MVKTYDPAKVNVILGTAIIGGYADGTFVKVARNSDSYALSMGADGEGTRTKSADKSGTVTITLKQSSDSNDTLSELQLADELTSAPFPLAIRDNSGRSLYTAATAWVKKPADGEYGKEAGDREWVIETDELIMFAGGN